MAEFFIPSNKFDIIDESVYSDKIKKIEKVLNAYAVKSYFKSYDGKSIAYEYYLCKNAEKTIVISHGFTEFADKYHELIWYFLNMGYNVFIVTHRGHGYSYRETENLQITHINSFNQYVKDFECFIDGVVLKICSDTQLYMFAHSMGGAIAVLYMQKHPDMFKKAFLSAPMICPQTKGTSITIARTAAFALSVFRGAKRKFFIGKEFNPNAKFENGGSTSKCRFEKNLQKRIDDDNYKTSMGSNKWIYKSLTVSRKLLNEKQCGRINTKVFIAVAELDSVVQKEPQFVLANIIKNAEIFEFKGAKHEIYSSVNNVLSVFLKKVFDFYAER